jgi:hypothetical protein
LPKSTQLVSFLARLDRVRCHGERYTALCPAHEDNNASLSISEKNGKILVKCFAGCQIGAVCRAIGIEVADLFSKDQFWNRIVAVYSYRDEDGNLLYQNVRYAPKDFRWRRADGKKRWIWKLGDTRRVLYNLPELQHAEAVLFVEGEKDAEAGKALGFTSTTSGGAGSWRDEFRGRLRNKRVTIICDADEVGREHAKTVAGSLAGNVRSLKLLELPGAKDLSDWIENGGTRTSLDSLIEDTPEWETPHVKGANVLDNLVIYVKRFVSLSELQAFVVALWVCHTYLFSACAATPYLAITSAEKRSGKTRLLEVLETLVFRPWFTGRVTPAVLIRKIDAGEITLLLDETDAAFGTPRINPLVE